MGNISGWTEVIMLSIIFVTVLGLVVANFNLLYDKNNDLGLSTSSTEQLFIEYQDSASDQINGGEVEFDATQGITLKSSFGIAKDAMSISWSFITGGWIEQIASYMNAGEAGMALARGLRILYFLSLVFALLYGLFKVVL